MNNGKLLNYGLGCVKSISKDLLKNKLEKNNKYKQQLKIKH